MRKFFCTLSASGGILPGLAVLREFGQGCCGMFPPLRRLISMLFYNARDGFARKIVGFCLGFGGKGAGAGAGSGELAEDGGVGDFLVGGEKESFGKDDGERGGHAGAGGVSPWNRLRWEERRRTLG